MEGKKNNAYPGTFYGVGIGPGDPRLLTIRARDVLLNVETIFVPQKSEQSNSVGESIILQVLPEVRQKIKRLTLPMSQDRLQLESHWQQAVDTIWHALCQGNDCAFVNIGDPLLYGTFIYIMQDLHKIHPEVRIEIVPGIMSINAASASSLLPLASENESIAILSGNVDPSKVKNVLEQFDTVIFMKINRSLNKLLSVLEEMDLLQKSVFVSKCTTQEEKIIRDLSQLKHEKVDYFSLLIVRK